MNRATILPPLQINWVTHPGTRGKRNDDYAEYFRIKTNQGDRELLVLALADGVTSTGNGDQASQLAIETIKKSLGQEEDGQRLPQRLDKAIAQANLAIWHQAQTNIAQRNMSTTVVLATIDGERLYVAHVGDSRAYLIRDNAIHRLTLDHTWVQEALDVGRLTEQSARRHLNRHVIQRYLGGGQQVEVDHEIIAPGTYSNSPLDRKRLKSLTLQPGDVVLLCSDGLTESVSDTEIKGEVLRLPSQPKLVAEALIELALERNEGDNITVMVLAFPISQPFTMHTRSAVEPVVTLAPPKKALPNNWLRRATTIAVLCLLLIILASGLGEWRNQIGLQVSSAAPIPITANRSTDTVTTPTADNPQSFGAPSRLVKTPTKTNPAAIALNPLTPTLLPVLTAQLPTPTTASTPRVPTGELPTATPIVLPTSIATKTPTPLPTESAVQVQAINLSPSADLVIQERNTLSFQLSPQVYSNQRFLIVGWEAQATGLDQFHCLQPAAGELLPFSNGFALQSPSSTIEIPITAQDLHRKGIKEGVRYCWGVSLEASSFALLSSPRDDLKLRIESERDKESKRSNGRGPSQSPTAPTPRNEQP